MRTCNPFYSCWNGDVGRFRFPQSSRGNVVEIARLFGLQLELVGALTQARYVVYRSIQPDWWESIDMADALHPQTLVTFGMNGGELPVRFGGPLRLRVPRQLGYKSVKYITRLTLTDSLKRFGQGLGSAEPEGG
jgi:DMSO/TMAO reductase YedYZ molybdopterin-dependent catalytic subunit